MIFLLILLLPSQFAYHFWPSWSLVYGIRVDYLSPTLYLTDLIILGLFLTSRLRVRVPLFIIIFSVLNILISSFPLLTIYKWLRLLEYFWLFKYLTLKIAREARQSRFKLSREAGSRSAGQIENFKFAVLWTSALAWSQFTIQHSVGGLWYWLGERTFNIATPGIAKIHFIWNLGFRNWDFGLFLRPYATLPHPNALAGFLLVTGLVLYSLNRRITPAVVIAFLTVPLTFSRTALILEVLILIIWACLKIKNYSRSARNSMLKIVTALVLLVSSIYYLVSISGSPTSLSERIVLNDKAIQTIKHFPVFGVGLGNFIYQVPTIRQPAHNIYLLVASELGLPAVLFIGYFVIKSLRYLLCVERCALSVAILVVATTGLLDHYWLTLHQNILLLVVLLAFIKVKSERYEPTTS